MNDLQAPLVAITGFVALRLALTDGYLAYLKPGMRIPLMLAGSLLLVLGLVGFVRWWRQLGRGEEPADRHAHAPRVALLLLAPVLVLLLVTPAPLGSDAIGRGGTAGDGRRAASSGATAGPLGEPVDGAVELSLTDFMARATLDRSGSLREVRVRLTGFVARGPDAGTFALTRFALVCCAADAFALQVEVRDAPAPLPAPDAWVEVEGIWAEAPPAEGDDLPVVALRAERVRPIPAPANPYE